MTEPLPILVVDDDADTATEVSDFLKRRGFETVDVHSGAAAIACLEKRAFAAVFTDIDMPGHPNGVGLAHWVQKHQPGTKVILTSGAFPWISARSPIADVPFLVKPADLNQLVVLLRKIAPSPADAATVRAAD